MIRLAFFLDRVSESGAFGCDKAVLGQILAFLFVLFLLMVAGLIALFCKVLCEGLPTKQRTKPQQALSAKEILDMRVTKGEISSKDYLTARRNIEQKAIRGEPKQEKNVKGMSTVDLQALKEMDKYVGWRRVAKVYKRQAVKKSIFNGILIVLLTPLTPILLLVYAIVIKLVPGLKKEVTTK